MIQAEQTIIPDCILLKPDIFKDSRGVFTEIYKQTILPKFIPIQSNCSISKTGVLRGIHRTPYAKLVTCISGKIYDVCVDLRPNSPSYKETFGVELNSSNMYSLYIPPYCGHGFLALEQSIVIYHQDDEYSKIVDETYCYKQFNIRWPQDPLIVSDKDLNICN